MGRKILFITTDQQRYDSLGCNGGTVARTPVVDGLAARGHQLPARVQPEHRVHAGALDDAHRPVRAHARRDRERRAAARRRAERRRVPAATRPATAPRCSARRTSSPASTSTCKWAENRMAERGIDRAVPRLRARRARDARARRRQAPLQHYGQWLHRHARHRGDAGLLAAARGRTPRRRHRRARDAAQPDPARLVPHRLGRRPHDRVPRLAARRRRLVRLDVVPRPAPPVGSAGVGASPRATGATSTCRPGTRARNEKIERCSRRSPRTGSRCCEGTCVNVEGGPGTYRPQNVMTTTTSARSTR